MSAWGAAALAIAVLAAGCGSDAERDDPEAVAKTFRDAVCEGDVETAHGLLGAPEGVPLPSEEYLADALERRYRHFFGDEGERVCRIADESDFELDSESEADAEGTATVWVQSMDGAGAIGMPVPMIERDGDWHVHITAVVDLE